VHARWTVRNAQFSPDGRWVAYATNETGTWEVFVSPFPNANSKWKVSRSGGEQPKWRRDGKELFYFSGEGKMMSVSVKTGSNFEAGTPVALFQTHTRQPISSMDLFSYDLTVDGQKFLINARVDEPSSAPLSIILNWASEIEKKLVVDLANRRNNRPYPKCYPARRLLNGRVFTSIIYSSA